MSEDAKAKLKEKMGAVASDEELEKVAGGTQEENIELLEALRPFNPTGVDALLNSAQKGQDVSGGIYGILSEANIPGLYVRHLDTEDDNEYSHLFEGEFTHWDAIGAINAEAEKRGLR